MTATHSHPPTHMHPDICTCNAPWLTVIAHSMQAGAQCLAVAAEVAWLADQTGPLSIWPRVAHTVVTGARALTVHPKVALPAGIAVSVTRDALAAVPIG